MKLRRTKKCAIVGPSCTLRHEEEVASSFPERLPFDQFFSHAVLRRIWVFFWNVRGNATPVHRQLWRACSEWLWRGRCASSTGLPAVTQRDAVETGCSATARASEAGGRHAGLRRAAVAGCRRDSSPPSTILAEWSSSSSVSTWCGTHRRQHRDISQQRSYCNASHEHFTPQRRPDLRMAHGAAAQALHKTAGGHECRARLVFQTSRYDHITPLFRRLHWLRAPHRISFKLAVMVYQCVRGLGPAYLADALQPVARIPGPQRLRSSSTSALNVPSTRLSTVGDRSVYRRRGTNMEQFASWRDVIPCKPSKPNLNHVFLASNP